MMSKSLLITLISLFAIASYGQKIKFDENIASVDGKPFLNWKSDGAGNTNISISGLSATKDEIFVSYVSYSDPNKVTSSNPKGTVGWYEFHFLGLGLKCEVDNKTKKGLVKFILENDLYVDGLLNEENVKIVVAKYGTRYSDNRPGNNVNIYIEK